MARQTVVLDLGGDHKLARDLVAGGVFVPGCALALLDDCELIVRAGSDELSLEARCVFVDPRGAGLELVDRSQQMKQRIAAMANLDEAATRRESKPPAVEPEPVAAPEPEPEPNENHDDDDDGDGDGDKKVPSNLSERLRGLTLAQQLKLAHHGEVSERIVLERMYGKTVWEALLRNPRVTGPEVARIARMGALPRTMIELIVGNGAWLQMPEIRRALLSNARLGTDQILKILRLLPKHELKLAASQSAYSHAVRDAAKRLIRENA